MSSPYPFNTRALTEPANPQQVKAHRDHLRNTGRAPKGGTAATVMMVVVGLVMFIVILPMAMVFFGILTSIASSTNGVGQLVLLPGGLIFAGILALIVFLIVKAIRSGGGDTWYRLDHFAQANGMTWFPVAASPPLPGMIFNIGSSRSATNIVRGTKPRLVEFGNYQFTTGSGKNKSTHKWGYVAVHLSSPLPHIVLDAVGNNSIFGSNLPATFDKDQRLSLEGNFDSYFSLYCPSGYETDALYLFTPDIMARFIDNAAALDVEIVDDWVFFYIRGEASTTDPARWAWLFSVVGSFLDKFAQWERWRDDRLALSSAGAPAAAAGALTHAPVPAGAPLPFAAPTGLIRPPQGVSMPGRRLQRGVAWRTIIPILIVGLIYAVTNLVPWAALLR